MLLKLLPTNTLITGNFTMNVSGARAARDLRVWQQRPASWLTDTDSFVLKLTMRLAVTSVVRKQGVTYGPRY